MGATVADENRLAAVIMSAITAYIQAEEPDQAYKLGAAGGEGAEEPKT